MSNIKLRRDWKDFKSGEVFKKGTILELSEPGIRQFRGSKYQEWLCSVNGQISAIPWDDAVEIGIEEQQSASWVGDRLRHAGDIYDQRNSLYGDNYKRFGLVMIALFPEGLTLKTVDDFNRFGIFVQSTSKVTRYAAQFTNGGHPDSLDDQAVYAEMLQELDFEIAKRNGKDLSPWAIASSQANDAPKEVKGESPRDDVAGWNRLEQ